MKELWCAQLAGTKKKKKKEDEEELSAQKATAS